MEFPLKGYRFRPNDQQLVGYYLFNKITGSTPLPSPCVVHDFDVFGKQEPEQIWDMFRSSSEHDPDPGDLYFFTKPKKTTPKGKRFNRQVGSGTWKGQDSGRKICGGIETGEAVVIGLKKRFHYENKKQSKEQDGSWIMFEYCLAGSLGNCITGPDNDYVLCQIRKKIVKTKKRNNLVIMSCGGNDDDGDVMPPLMLKTEYKGIGEFDDGAVLFAVPPLMQTLPCQEEPPFPILMPQDLLPLVLVEDDDDGHNTNVLVDPLPLPLPLPCPQQQQPPLPQSALPLPLPPLDDDYHFLPPLVDLEIVDFIGDFFYF